MLIEKGKHIAIFLGTVVLPGMVIGSLFVTSNPVMKLLKADGSNIVLDSNTNLAFDENGNGTFVDAKGITWEYHNASSYSDGLITLKDRSYFGISSSTAWGITGISNVTANFTGNELWLLTSTDGIEWHEQEILTSGQSTSEANNWRYIRFYNYESTIDINSVSIGYSCSGDGAFEDVDSAHVENIVTLSSNLTATRETVDVSPRGDSSEAIRLTRSNNNNSNVSIKFNKAYKVSEVANKKIEFDIKGDINFSKTIQILDGTTNFGSSIESGKHSSYIVTPINAEWNHIEIAVPCLVSLISGYDRQDLPAGNVASRNITGIRINARDCVIDNLKFGSSATSLGIYNNGTSFSATGVYWFKISWVGVMHSVVITVDDDTVAEQVSPTDPKIKNGSPLYLKGKKAGTIVATARFVVGYDRRVLTISNTLTVK